MKKFHRGIKEQEVNEEGRHGALKIVCVIKSKLTFRNKIVLSSEIYIFILLLLLECHKYMRNVTA